MKWLPYFILAYVMAGLQVGLAGHLQFHGAAPNLILIAAVFIAINAPRQAALLGCFVLGLIQDMLTLQPPGTYALGYSLLGGFVASAKEIVYREHPVTHVVVTLVGGLLSGMVLLLGGWIHHDAPGVGQVVLTALYSAALAPLVLWGLQRLRGAFSFTQPRRRL
jgi:rod shape-determining protein MreD